MSRNIVPESTVKIGERGVSRISQDLFRASRLSLLSFDQKAKQLRFRLSEDQGVKVYRSSPEARSGTFALKSVLKMFGLMRHMGHMYEARIERGELIIDFTRRVDNGKVTS